MTRVFVAMAVILTAVICFGMTPAMAVVSLAISPADVDSAYTGNIDFQINGLTTGQTVWVRAYVDFNANGVLDTGEQCAWSMRVTDGTTANIAGISYAPGDEDNTANGRIHTIVRGALSGSASAEYIWRVENVANAPLASTSFTVTQHNYGQYVSGQVLAAGGGTIPNVLIGVTQGGGMSASTYTNAAGSYQLSVPPGSYEMYAFKPGYVGEGMNKDLLHVWLTAGVNAVANGTLTAATRHLRGSVVDAATNVGIPFILTFAMDGDGSVAMAYSNALGVFDLPVAPSIWGGRLIDNSQSLSILGYDAGSSISGLNTTTGDVTGIKLTATKGTALVYGYLLGAGDAPLSGVQVWLYKQKSDEFNYVSGSKSDTDGKITFVVQPGTYCIEISPRSHGYIQLGHEESRPVTVSAGMAGEISLPVRKATAHVKGQIINNTGGRVPNLRIDGYETISGSGTNVYPDSKGAFDLPVFGGSWNVGIDEWNLGDGYVRSPDQNVTIADGGTVSGIVLTISRIPTITSFTPSSGLAGTTVTITGTSFTGATAVRFNGVAATSFKVVSATSITAVVPKTTTGKITVTTPGGTATSAASFTFIPVPTITSFTPLSGGTGITVTITGTGLTGATAVKFNGVAATSFAVVSATSITAVVPKTTTGKITVITPGGTATSAASFTFIPGPTITSFTPSTGTAGTSVTITGTNFTGATAVKFNGVAAASFSVVSATSIKAVAPAKPTSGKISVTTPGGTATSTALFYAPPTITTFSPTSVGAGTTVTIGGTNFTGATAVRFNGVAATSFTVVSATVITAVVPVTTTGKISVTTPGGTATSSASFTFIAAPTITSFSPSVGAAGVKVTITGAKFTGATAVKFNGVSATSFAVVNATSITAFVPANPTTGKITVTTPGGTATSSASFFGPPTITSFTPARGGVGTTVTITGKNLTGATTFKFNGTAAKSFTVVSATSITAVVPVTTTGRLTVTTPGGSTPSATVFTFIPAPTISSYSPTSGAAGVKVTITGTGFNGATAVKFNGVSATSFAVVGATSITAFVPVNPTTGKIGVTTPGGTGTSAASFTTSYSGVMIYIPAGSFLMGNNGTEGNSYSDELPQHSVSLSGYYIGKCEVTRGEYRQFVNAGGYSNSTYWSGDGWAWKVGNGRTEPGYWAAIQDWSTGTFTQTENHPVVGVSYYEAEAFCKWAGGRLPTEAQWEKAARWTGSHSNAFPWGDTWDAEKCNNYYDHNSAGGGYMKFQTAAVGSYPLGKSPYGCLDMAGNVGQWCKDWYGSTYYSTSPTTDPQGPASGSTRVMRGGGWNYDNSFDRSAFRGGGFPYSSENGYGFRLTL